MSAVKASKSLAGSLAAFGIAATAQAQEVDPCDFVSSGATSFTYEQVASCYASVPFDAADLANIIEVIEQHRSFSDLAEAYDARVHWRDALAAIAARDFPNDAAMHDALKREHHEFRNVHVAYLPPSCYSALVIGFTPIEFGSLLREVDGALEQLIFVEAALFPQPYQQATGIDATALIGQRVVSINGVPVLDYMRAYADDLKIHVDAGGALNGVLASDNYSLRLNGGGDYLPDRGADEYVLESVDGQVSHLVLPWVYIPRALVQPASALPLTRSSHEFADLCRPPLDATPAVGASSTQPTEQPFGVDDDREPIVRRMRERAVRLGPEAVTAATPGAFYEVPPERLGQDVEVVIPPRTNATVLQYDGNVTAIKLQDTNAWVDVVREGVEYACENSDRLIIDLRGNSGGNDTTIRWLHHYLFPEQGQLVAAGLLPLRLRKDNPVFSELLFNSARFMADYAPVLGLEPCELSFTPGCLTDVDTGEPLVAGPDWFRVPSVVEARGGVPVALSRIFGVWNVGDPEFDSASCAGRFQADDLVFITDGRNASGGYFLPAAFKGQGVIVNTGGYVGEPMAMGRAASGASISVRTFAGRPQAIEEATNGEVRFETELYALERRLDVRMEMLGVYLEDLTTLHLDAPIQADLHVNVWTDLPGSEGFVYERVLEAVDVASAGSD